MAVALHQTPPGPHGQYPAFDLSADPVQGIPVGEEIPLGPGGQTPGGHGHAIFPVHLDDDEINGCPHHVLEHKVGSGLFLFPHLRVGDDHPHSVGHHDGAVHGLFLHGPGFFVPDTDVEGVHADDGASEGTAAPVGGVDGVPLLTFLCCQPSVQGLEIQIVEALPVTFLGRGLRLKRRGALRFHPEGFHGSGFLRYIHRFFRGALIGRSVRLPVLSTVQAFNLYDDIRDKLVAGGMPREQVAFIHEAETDAQKKELFAKVNSDQVRVLIGSTQKMGAGTNIQQRLIASHDLECPWRPRDLIQRKGRIERRGNMNKKVHVFRYVTEATFDAYLWQAVENKQKFISQIMTSRSPVRSCEDVDEATLSFAEIKALCAGDPRIKERIELDMDVSRLRLLKASHQSQQYRMEDNVLRYFPQQIKETEAHMVWLRDDMETLAQHPHPEDGFTGMTVLGRQYAEKATAGAALLDACKDITGLDSVTVGSYRGFSLSLSFSGFKHVLTLKGRLSYELELGEDPRGNLTRIDNGLKKLSEHLADDETRLAGLRHQLESAKAELGKPFLQEEELKQKSARLAELDALLNIGSKASSGQAA